MIANAIRRYSALCLVMSIMILTCSVSRSEVVDKISIVVNDEIITESEVQSAIRPAYEKYRGLYSGDELMKKLEEARQKVAERLIEDRLILSEAKRLGILVEVKEVDDKINDVVRQLGSRKAFEKAIADQGISLKELKTRYQEQLMTKKLIDQKIGTRITVSPVEIADYYDKFKGEFTQPEQVKLRNILISFKKEPDQKKALKLAKETSDRLKEGCDFSGLAKIYSDGPGAQEGGLMGFVTRGYLFPEIDEVVFKLKEGETSEIVKTSLGYHIFKVEEIRTARTLSISEVRREIEEAVFRDKINEKLKEWIENLKKNAYIAFR